MNHDTQIGEGTTFPVLGTLFEEVALFSPPDNRVHNLLRNETVCILCLEFTPPSAGLHSTIQYANALLITENGTVIRGRWPYATYSKALLNISRTVPHYVDYN